MALVLADRVKETTTTTGTGTYTLAGAADSSFETFASIGNGNTTYYACTDGSDFEVGIGTYTASGTTLARTTILQSSNSDAAVNWGAGTKDIFCTQPAEKAVYLDASGNIEAFNASNLTALNASNLSSGTVPNARLDAQLQDVAGLAVTNGNFIVGDGSNFVAESGSTARTSLGLGTASVLDTGISNTNIPKFTSGVADDDFLRVSGTSIEGRSASEVLSDIGGQASLTFGISNTNAVKIDSTSVADNEFARFTANGLESRSTSEVLSDIGAITASSTDTLTNKTIDASQLSGTVANARLDQQLQDVAGLAVTNGNFIVGDGSNFVAESGATARTSLGLGTAATLDTGISNTNVPKFTTGVVDDDFLRVNGTAIEGRSASEVLSDIGGQASLTFGISNTNAVKVDSTSVADDEYARFTASGLESRSTAEVLSDIGGQASLTFGISNTNAVKIDSASVADDEYARFTANGLESRSTSEVLSDIGAITASSTDTLTNKTINASQLSGTVDNARLDAQLQDVAGLAVTNGGFIVGDGSNFVLETGDTVRTSLGLGTAAVLDTGISNTNVPKFTSGVADDDFLRVAGTAIEGRSASEVLSDIGGQASLTFGISNTNAVKIDSTSVADNEYARFTANGLESRSTSEVLSDIGGISASSTSTLTNKTLTTPVINGFSGTGDGSITGDLTLTSTDGGATENPTLDLFRNSASPADGDVLGHINFSGEDSAGNQTVYAKIEADIADVTDGTEDGRLDIGVVSAGTFSNRITLQGNGVTRFSNKDVELSNGVSLKFEGATGDVNEMTLTVADPTADRTITLPDATGTVQLTDGSGASLTSLNASQLTSGTVPNARLDQQLQDVAGLAVTNGNFIVGDGSNFVAESGSTARDSLSLGTSSDVQFDSFGVGTAASGTTGEIRATADITSNYSDERLKNIHGTIPNALDKVKSLGGYYFTENETAKSLGYNNDAQQVGVIAQEVEKVLPEAVKPAPIDDKYLTVQYEKMVPLLIEAMKEQQAKIEELEARLANLEA